MSAPAGKVAPTPEAAWPNDTYSEPQKNLYFNGEAVQIFHQPGNTDGNSIVMFRRSDVISTGDLVDLTSYPVIDVERGGSIQGVVDGLNRLKLMAVPAEYEEGGTMIIPGHGRLSDRADLSWYQQMVTIVRDRLQDMIGRGMTLDAGEGGQADTGFRWDLRQHDGQVDDGHVCRGCLQEPQQQAARSLTVARLRIRARR